MLCMRAWAPSDASARMPPRAFSCRRRLELSAGLAYSPQSPHKRDELQWVHYANNEGNYFTGTPANLPSCGCLKRRGSMSFASNFESSKGLQHVYNCLLSAGKQRSTMKNAFIPNDYPALYYRNYRLLKSAHLNVSMAEERGCWVRPSRDAGRVRDK